MIRLIDSRTLEQISQDRLAHASQVAIKRATGYFGTKFHPETSSAHYARIAATEAFTLNPTLRIGGR